MRVIKHNVLVVSFISFCVYHGVGSDMFLWLSNSGVGVLIDKSTLLGLLPVIGWNIVSMHKLCACARPFKPDP